MTKGTHSVKVSFPKASDTNEIDSIDPQQMVSDRKQIASAQTS